MDCPLASIAENKRMNEVSTVFFIIGGWFILLTFLVKFRYLLFSKSIIFGHILHNACFQKKNKEKKTPCFGESLKTG